MPPVVIGGAIAAAGAVGAAAIGSSAAGKATKSNQQAADTAANETRAAREQAYQTLSPYVNVGRPAAQTINALLGLDDGSSNYEQYLPQRASVDQAANSPAQGFKGLFGFDAGQTAGPTIIPPTYTPDEIAAAKQAAAAANRQQADQAFNRFRTSTGYDWRLQQGMNALNSGYAGAGTLKSGAAIKGAVDYGQGMASQEFGNYLNALGNQQSLGMQAGAASAGVGTNAANTLGSIYLQNGSNQANAALVKASAVGQGLNSLANIGGSILGQSQGYGGGGINPSALWNVNNGISRPPYAINN